MASKSVCKCKSKHVEVKKKEERVKIFNPYCLCQKRSCSGVKQSETGELMLLMNEIFSLNISFTY